MSNKNISVKFRKYGGDCKRMIVSIPLSTNIGCIELPGSNHLLSALHYENSTDFSYQDLWVSVKRNRELENPQIVEIVVKKDKRPPF